MSYEDLSLSAPFTERDTKTLERELVVHRHCIDHPEDWTNHYLFVDTKETQLQQIAEIEAILASRKHNRNLTTRAEPSTGCVVRH